MLVHVLPCSLACGAASQLAPAGSEYEQALHDYLGTFHQVHFEAILAATRQLLLRLPPTPGEMVCVATRVQALGRGYGGRGCPHGGKRARDGGLGLASSLLLLDPSHHSAWLACHPRCARRCTLAARPPCRPLRPSTRYPQCPPSRPSLPHRRHCRSPHPPHPSSLAPSYRPCHSRPGGYYR